MLDLNFHPFPTLETERLILREITLDDAEKLFEMRSSAVVLRYIDRLPHRSLDDTNEMIRKIKDGIEKNETVAWGITLKNQKPIIGTISFHRIEIQHYRAEIGYMLHPDHWRKGITNEAMIHVIDYGFNKMKLHSIEANINPGNAASAGILKKHGFVKEAFFKENYFFNGKFMDTEIYSKINPKNIFESINALNE